MKSTISLVMMLTAIGVPWASAQPVPAPEAPLITMSWQAADGQVATFEQGVGFGPVDLVAVEPFERMRPVAGAPYSAEAVTEVTQPLADGNRIQRRTVAKVARDGQGRVRREQQVMPLGGLVAEAANVIVTISDPVAGTFFTLDQERKTAMRSRSGGFEISERIGAMGKFPGAGARIATGGMVMGSAMSGKPYAAGEAATMAVETQPLGTQDFDGVRAEGTRTTSTIPAGAIGNELPIEMVGERWYSPELQAVVMTRRSDPRFGETIYRLTNIVRAEPPANLFQIPPDFRIEEPKLVPPPRVKPDGR